MKLTKRFLLVFSCLVFVLALDGPAVFLVQAFAWTKMAYSFGHRDSALVALKKTFDGKHPCHICKRLSAQKAPQMKAPFLDGKLDDYDLTILNGGVKIPSGKVVYFLPKKPFIESVEISPPTPPPRAT